MFSRWLFVRLKAAEKALRQGRIDDACAAALQPDLRQHPRGQKLLDQLVKPLMSRARLHRQAGRYQEALADLGRLEALGRAGPDVQTLRQRIAEEVRQDAQQDAARQEAYHRAADHLRAGRLETGRLNIERIEDTGQREQLADELEHHLRRGSELLRQAATALDRDDVLTAARLWEDACRGHGRTAETDKLAVRLAKAYRQTLEQWHKDGRVERLLSARRGMKALLPADPALAEWARVVALCSRAVAQLTAADYAGLRQTLLQLKGVRDKAAWVDSALEALVRVAEGRDLLLASPLGLCASTAGRAAPPAVPADPDETRVAVPALALEPPDPDAIKLDRPLLMLVDGGGSSLLIQRDRIRIGSAGTTAEIDVPIPAEIQGHHADLIRRGEDYFLTAYGPAQVNHRRVEHTLLRDDDRIVLGSSAKMVFSKPSSKSESAVLRLSHRCRLPQDVGDVVLFRETCLIGPGPTCHVRTREGKGQLVLFERGGVLYARQTAGSGYLSAPVHAVVAGRTIDFGDLRLTVKPYEEPRAERRADRRK